MDSTYQLPRSFVATINLPIKICQFIGLDFFDVTTNHVKNRCKLVIFLIIFATFFSSQVFFIVMVDEIGASFLDVANAIPCLMIMIQNISKLTLIRKKHLIRQIIVEISELWPGDFVTIEKENVMKEWLRRLNMFCDTVFKFTMIGVIAYMWIKIFIYFFITSRNDGDTPYLYPFQLYYPFKIDALWKYLTVYLLQSVAGSIIHNCVYQSCDLMLVTLTMDVCVLLRLLQYDLINIRVDKGRTEESLANLKHIVKTHQKLLRLAENLNEIFGGIMFTVMVFSSVIFCFFGFLTIVVKAKVQFFINVITVMQILFIVFYITLPGQILSDTSSGVADAAYKSLWYNSDPRFRKIIFIIIARSQKPCKLKALGLGNTDMDFGAFCKICSTGWSYLSLVNQMYQKVEFEV